MTPGVGEFEDLEALIMAVRTYDDFNGDNDPWGEHDMVTLDWHDERVFGKIDYYDEAMQGLGDPSSPDCNRVMTLMLSSEY